MSTLHESAKYQIAKALFTLLNDNVTVDDVTYSVYNAVPSDADDTYVVIEGITEKDSGTKDEFVYEGTVTITVHDVSGSNVNDKKLALSIQKKVRNLVKPSRSYVLTLVGFTMIHFTFSDGVESVGMTDNGIPEIRLTDIYKFKVE